MIGHKRSSQAIAPRRVPHIDEPVTDFDAPEVLVRAETLGTTSEAGNAPCNCLPEGHRVLDADARVAVQSRHGLSLRLSSSRKTSTCSDLRQRKRGGEHGTPPTAGSIAFLTAEQHGPVRGHRRATRVERTWLGSLSDAEAPGATPANLVERPQALARSRAPSCATAGAGPVGPAPACESWPLRCATSKSRGRDRSRVCLLLPDQFTANVPGL